MSQKNVKYFTAATENCGGFLILKNNQFSVTIAVKKEPNL